jgi:membrane protein implicated in regulation of membrane protease activity
MVEIEEFFTQVSQYIGFLWLFLAMGLLFLEMVSPGLFFCLSFAIGFIGAAIMAFFGAAFLWQCLGGLLISCLVLVFFKMVIKPVTQRHNKTNVDALVGKQATVVDDIVTYKVGKIIIRGEEWPAITRGKATLTQGSLVTIIGIEGNKLIVQ